MKYALSECKLNPRDRCTASQPSFAKGVLWLFLAFVGLAFSYIDGCGCLWESDVCFEKCWGFIDLVRSMGSKDKKRRRLIYQSTHRGGKELDIILGGFAVQYLEKAPEEDLDAFDEILGQDDELLKDVLLYNQEPKNLSSQALKLFGKIKEWPL